MKRCPTCLSPLADGFRFCPKCGSAIPTDPLPAPPGGLTIEFAASTSPGFQFALQEAVRQPGFERLGTDKKPVFRVTFSKGHSGDAMRLVELVKPWRNKAVYVDGEPLPWEQVFSFVSCFARRQAAYRPGSYCFGGEAVHERNIWGCKQSRLFWSDWSEWFCWGRFVDKTGTFEFDKTRIKHELARNLFPYRFCPALDMGLTEAMLAAFPEHVTPKVDRHWKFITNEWQAGTLGFSISLNRDQGTGPAMGVAPRDDEAALEIAARAKREIEVPRFEGAWRPS